MNHNRTHIDGTEANHERTLRIVRQFVLSHKWFICVGSIGIIYAARESLAVILPAAIKALPATMATKTMTCVAQGTSDFIQILDTKLQVINVQNRLTLYAPIITALLSQALGFTIQAGTAVVLHMYGFTVDRNTAQTKILQYQKKGLEALGAKQYVGAYNNFHKARELYETNYYLRTPDECETYISLCHREALILIHIGRWTTPADNHALKVLLKAKRFEQRQTDILNLLGTLYLLTDNHTSAKDVFEQSLELNCTQNGIQIILGVLQNNPQPALKYNPTDYADSYFNTNDLLGILLFHHAFGLYQYTKNSDFQFLIKSSRIKHITKAIDLVMLAMEHTPKNEAFKTQFTACIRLSIDLLIYLTKNLDGDEKAFLKSNASQQSPALNKLEVSAYAANLYNQYANHVDEKTRQEFVDKLTSVDVPLSDIDFSTREDAGLT